MASTIVPEWSKRVERGDRDTPKGRSRYDLEHFIQSVLVTREDGGWLDVAHRASPRRIRIIRASGDDSAAEVVLAIPRATWSQPKAEQLARMFEQQGISFTTDPGSFALASSAITAAGGWSATFS
jgi:hypothetical protein